TRPEEISFHLFHQKLLRFRLPGLKAVLVEQHLGMLAPHAPSLGADVFIDFLAQRSVKRWLIKAWKLSPELHAFHHSCHENIVQERGNGSCEYRRVSREAKS